MLLRCLAVLALGLAPSEALAAKVGKPAPKFVIVAYEGQQVASESVRG